MPTLPRSTRVRGAAVALVALVSAIALAVAWPFGDDDDGGNGRSLSGNPAAPRPPKPPPGDPSIADRDIASFDPLAYDPDDEGGTAAPGP